MYSSGPGYGVSDVLGYASLRLIIALRPTAIENAWDALAQHPVRSPCRGCGGYDNHDAVVVKPVLG
jgi:hypothetical protein